MDFVTVDIQDGIARLTYAHGKVNALSEPAVDELHQCFRELNEDDRIKAIIFTGAGRFFSFGFDIPGFLSYSKQDFYRYIEKFTNLYTYMFLLPKPLIAAINGHAIAGGCMLTLACDHRLMVPFKAKISLNEIGFGSTVMAGSVEMLRFAVGSKNATEILYSGDMYSADQALDLGLIDRISPAEAILEDALTMAQGLAQKQAPTFKSIKMLLRKPVAEQITAREKASLTEFVDIWYSEETWAKIKQIEIHG